MVSISRNKVEFVMFEVVKRKVNTFEAQIMERGVPSVYGRSVQSNEKLFRSSSSELSEPFRTMRTRVKYKRERE